MARPGPREATRLFLVLSGQCPGCPGIQCMLWAAGPKALLAVVWGEGPQGKQSKEVLREPDFGSAFSATPRSIQLRALLPTPRALWHHQCKNEESNFQVLQFYWPSHQQYLWLVRALVQLSSDSVRELSRLSDPLPLPPLPRQTSPATS